MAGIWVVLQENPVILWGGIVLGALIFLITKHLEKREEQELEAPQPSSLDEIVKPKVREHVEARGKEPGSKALFKIGRDVKGQVSKYVETEMSEELLNPNPRKDDDGVSEEGENDYDPEKMEDVRIIMIEPTGLLNSLKAILLAMLGNVDAGGGEKFYIFRKESFLETPGNEMVVDPEVMSWNFAGMEIEVANSARNVAHQAVQTEVSENVLAALPNYTEKVDYLFPLHSQEVSKIKEEGEHLHNDDEGF